MDKITLDRETFKMLASDTRLDILKALDERRKTVTELAREMKLNKATVFEHLEKLTHVELVKKVDDERKWVYYELSWKGRRLLHPERITIALLLSTAVASLATAAATFWLYATSPFGNSTASDPGAMGGPESADGEAGARGLAAPAEQAPPADGATDALFNGDPALLAAALGLGLLFVTLTVIAVVVWRRAKLARGSARVAGA